MATARLTAGQLRHPKPGKHCDGRGLWLYVKPNGQAYWVLRYRLNGTDRQMGLGPLADVTASEARARATHYRNLKRDGRDPLTERARERGSESPDFRTTAKRMIEARRPEWRNPKHAAQWGASLEAYAYPTLGDLPVDGIETDHVLKVLEPIWNDKTETANRVRQRIEAVLDYAKARGQRSGDNPARWRGHLDKLLAKPSKVKRVRHHPALPYSDLPDFMADLAKQGGIGAKALTFTILTAARTGEVLGATDDEVADGIWTVPPERTKSHRMHRVPLALQTQELIDALPSFAGSRYLFPSNRRGKHLSNMAMAKVLKTMGREDITVHGFRSTFRDWCAELTNFPRELAEAALAHVLKDKTEAAYQRGDLLERRAKMMQAWADYCLPNAQRGVVPIEGKRRA